VSLFYLQIICKQILIAYLKELFNLKLLYFYQFDLLFSNDFKNNLLLGDIYLLNLKLSLLKFTSKYHFLFLTQLLHLHYLRCFEIYILI